MSTVDIKKATDDYYKILKENGVDNILLYAVSKDNEHNVSFAKVQGLGRATAMLSMLVKIISMDADISSTDLAETIYDALKDAEEKWAEYEKEKQEQRERDISVNIDIQ